MQPNCPGCDIRDKTGRRQCSCHKNCVCRLYPEKVNLFQIQLSYKHKAEIALKNTQKVKTNIDNNKYKFCKTKNYNKKRFFLKIQ